ncbi:MAG: hypothetical protein MR407_05095 [Roseburia sp.]|nr:hypothetical protein [Roseburia sp.]
MLNSETKELIEQTVNETVIKIKTAGMLKDGRKTSIEKLEELLWNYPTFKKIEDKKYTVKLVEKVEAAFKSIENDPYFDVIRMFYFEGYTREYIALQYQCTETTISRNKTRLLKILAPMLFSDDVIFELFT